MIYYAFPKEFADDNEDDDNYKIEKQHLAILFLQLIVKCIAIGLYYTILA